MSSRFRSDVLAALETTMNTVDRMFQNEIARVALGQPVTFYDQVKLTETSGQVIDARMEGDRLEFTVRLQTGDVVTTDSEWIEFHHQRVNA